MAPQGHLLAPSLGNTYNHISFIDCSFEVHLYYVNTVNCLLQLAVESFILYGSIVLDGLHCEKSTRSDMPLILHLGVEARYLGNLCLLKFKPKDGIHRSKS